MELSTLLHWGGDTLIGVGAGIIVLLLISLVLDLVELITRRK